MAQEGRLPCGSITLYGSELWFITKLSYVCGRESIQRFSAQSKDSLLHACYLFCVIFLVLAASPPLSLIGNKLLSTPSLSWTHLPYPEGFWNTGSAVTELLVASWCGGHLEDLNLPSISDLLANQQAHDGSLLPSDFSLFTQTCRSDCPLLSIGSYDLPVGKLPSVGPSPLRISKRTFSISRPLFALLKH